jgi:serine/threonine protein kinase
MPTLKNMHARIHPCIHTHPNLTCIHAHIDTGHERGTLLLVQTWIHTHTKLTCVHIHIHTHNLHAYTCTYTHTQGMSKELSSTLSAGQTWIGTNSYMSPERVGGINYTFNADVWSLGLLVYQCCTAQVCTMCVCMCVIMRVCVYVY